MGWSCRRGSRVMAPYEERPFRGFKDLGFPGWDCWCIHAANPSALCAPRPATRLSGFAPGQSVEPALLRRPPHSARYAKRPFRSVLCIWRRDWNRITLDPTHSNRCIGHDRQVFCRCVLDHSGPAPLHPALGTAARAALHISNIEVPSTATGRGIDEWRINNLNHDLWP